MTSPITSRLTADSLFYCKQIKRYDKDRDDYYPFITYLPETPLSESSAAVDATLYPRSLDINKIPLDRFDAKQMRILDLPLNNNLMYYID